MAIKCISFNTQAKQSGVKPPHSKKRTEVGCIAGIVFMLAGVLSSAAATSEWQVVKGKHFLVYHVTNSVFADKISSRAEEYYNGITADLGFEKFDNFWVWENRAKIYIYPSRDDFMSATGSPDWAIGKTVTSRREIYTFSGDDSFAESVLPHEMTHLIFREFTGFKEEIPLWLNEGLAQWEEQAKRTQAVKVAKRLITGNRYVPLSSLMSVDVKKLVADGNAGEFYAQSASLVGFLIEKHGSERFRKMCGHLRDGKTMDDSLRFAYPDTIRNIEELEKAWKSYVLEKEEARK